jgi:hypothetical protein
MHSPPTVDWVRRKAKELSYDCRIIENGYRGLVAELIVGEAIGPEWKLVSANWNPYDFEHCVTRRRLEVKQTAVMQPSTKLGGPFERAKSNRFGIPKPEGGPREADIYVLADHADESAAANHFDATQWEFHVVAAKSLPSQKTIALTKVRRLFGPAVPWAGLRAAFEGVLATL